MRVRREYRVSSDTLSGLGAVVENRTERINGRWRECDKLNFILVTVVHVCEQRPE